MKKTNYARFENNQNDSFFANVSIGSKIAFISGYRHLDNYDYSLKVYTDIAFCFSEVSKQQTNEFVSQFIELIEMIDNEKATNIPFGKFTLLNEYHKRAIEIFYKQEILHKFRQQKLELIDNETHLNEYISFSIYSFIKMQDKISVLFLWPSSKKRIHEFELANEMIMTKYNVLYRQCVKLNYTGFYQLCFYLYKKIDAMWNDEKRTLDSFNPRFMNKVNKCWNKYNDITVFYIADKDVDEVVNLKYELRKLFEIGANSVHTCDGKQESLNISKILLNYNSLSFFNYAYFKRIMPLLDLAIHDNEKENDNYYLPIQAIKTMKTSGVISNINIDKMICRDCNMAWNQVFYINNLRIAFDKCLLKYYVKPYHFFLLLQKSKMLIYKQMKK